jgi:hypothetical protein
VKSAKKLTTPIRRTNLSAASPLIRDSFVANFVILSALISETFLERDRLAEATRHVLYPPSE